LKISLKKKGFFGDDERFLLYNVSEFLSNYNENNQKLYRLIFEKNLDEIKLDQEQHLIEGYEEKEDKNKIDGDEEDDDIVLKKDGETPDGDNKVDDKKKNIIIPINDGKTKEQMDEDDILYEENTAKMINKIIKWKNMDISDQIDLTCSNKDKEREREIRKKIRLRFKKSKEKHLEQKIKILLKKSIL